MIRRLLGCTMVALMGLPRVAAGQLPAGVPPDPARDADLPMLGAWIERWLPVVGAASYPIVDSTADFYAHGSDSVTAARLDGCTLVLHERLVSTVRGATVEKRLAIRVPLDQVDTAGVQPKIRQTRLLLTRPNIVLSGQLVVPLRSRTRDRFIAVSSEDEARSDTLVVEHLVPFVFAQVAGERGALALRLAAARCAPDGSRRRWRDPPPPNAQADETEELRAKSSRNTSRLATPDETAAPTMGLTEAIP
jgi:hypothetical protein